eukprot:CAMPEP_0202909688 /NCGR_PEP_ID=MMETSP1392-20130828/50045_1 /ASSEMBLY_ACC=CAM_ASM_000868 /TAXON_ID=225041 /ORGANISM="Chlamydomonas chlamydogama, Strain SAG 11-48b" /LENGTH=63 /DNA_ID=CAMNT_0049599529 /DNA_START=103 /DNA_END=294 /DNA_ORIENTATION=-
MSSQQVKMVETSSSAGAKEAPKTVTEKHHATATEQFIEHMKHIDRHVDPEQVKEEIVDGSLCS